MSQFQTSLPRQKNNVNVEKAIVKIIVLGCSNVGKTSLMERFATGLYSGIRRPTIGSDFMSRKIIIHDVEVTVQIWDTAGQERFQQGSLGSLFYRGANGALLVYDITNENSFEQIAQWRDECLSHKQDNDFFPIVVIGNKLDLKVINTMNNTTNTTTNDIMNDNINNIDENPIVQWCRDNSYGHIETSAKDGLGVEAAMLAISGLALEAKRDIKSSSSRRNQSTNHNSDKVHLNKMFEPKKRDCC